jgi:hypothetical protein
MGGNIGHGVAVEERLPKVSHGRDVIEVVIVD